jgi:hypothetical protein
MKYRLEKQKVLQLILVTLEGVEEESWSSEWKKDTRKAVIWQAGWIISWVELLRRKEKLEYHWSGSRSGEV